MTSILTIPVSHSSLDRTASGTYEFPTDDLELTVTVDGVNIYQLALDFFSNNEFSDCHGESANPNALASSTIYLKVKCSGLLISAMEL